MKGVVMTPPRSHVHALKRPAVARAFTIIELLVVTAIIILLVSLLVVAVNAATRTAQKTRTAALMDTIKKGLIQFKEDTGYYPPVLGPDADSLRDLFPSPPALGVAPSNPQINAVQNWWSSCSLAEYLVGWAEGAQDGYGAGPNSPSYSSSETPRTGIRDPGHDGVWKSTIRGAMQGRLVDRLPPTAGKPLGPYFEMKDERLLAGIWYVNGGNAQTFFPGDQLPAGLTWDTIPKVIVDYWGMPIRYYRRPYPQGAITQSYRAGMSVIDPSTNLPTVLQVPTLSDVFLLRPQQIKPGAESTNRLTDPGATGVPGSNATSRDLDSAEFALVSSGPDKRLNQNATMHPDNADNVVEVGP